MDIKVAEILSDTEPIIPVNQFGEIKKGEKFVYNFENYTFNLDVSIPSSANVPTFSQYFMMCYFMNPRVWFGNLGVQDVVTDLMYHDWLFNPLSGHNNSQLGE